MREARGRCLLTWPVCGAILGCMAKQPSNALSARDQEKYDLRALVIKAMAHPSRLMMIDALAEREQCVCELRALVGSDMSTVSKHLSVLKAAGIVQDRKVGLQVFYRLRVPCITRFFDCVESVLEARFGLPRAGACSSLGVQEEVDS